MSKRRKILAYVLENRKGLPSDNRKQVGFGLTLMSVFLFLVFLINFAIIIITDQRFGEDLSERAADVHQKTVTVQAKRGTIFDRSGKPIAEDSTTYSIHAILSKDYISAKKEKLYIQETQYETVAQILSEKLGLDPQFVKDQLALEDKYQVAFGAQGNNINYGTKVEIETAMAEAGIKGIGFTASPGRLYANGVFASHFIGSTRLEDNEDGTQSLIGSTGMEKSLDDILSGTDGIITYEKDAKGNIKPGTETVSRQSVNGRDVYTTLSEPLQSYLETNMDVFQSKTNGVIASATLVSADTGEILATTQRPTFDSDTKAWTSETENWNSALYQMTYEPGSTMKVMTLSSAIDRKVFDPSFYYNTESITIIDTTIYDWDVNQGLTTGSYLSLAQGFAHSSNVGMVTLQQRLGDDTWLNYLTKFDFGPPTRFGMADEQFGTVNSDNQVTIAMSSFGQGISVTQIQMLKAFSAVANQGEMITPKFISGIYDPNTDSARKGQREVVGKPVSEEAANETLKYMITVGTDPINGTLHNPNTGRSLIEVQGMPAAVKSGTAQIAKPANEGGGYLEGETNTLNSVVAMYPAEDPDFIMYVMVQQPEHWASIYWTDVVNPVLEEAVRLKDTLGLTSPSPVLDSVVTETKYKLPDVIGSAPGNVAAVLRQNLVHPIVVGTTNKIQKTSVKVGSNLSANEQILLWTGDLKRVPDMYGWTEKNVKQFEKWSGIEIIYKGDGSRVVDQSVGAETSVEDIKKITITLGE